MDRAGHSSRGRREWSLPPLAGSVALGLVLAVLATFLAAGPAAAHGISGDVADKRPLDFVQVGIEHMLLGWDHLLFVAAVVLVAGLPRRAAKLVSLFAVGHSTTLIAATLASWRVSARAVDVVIALSIGYVGAVLVSRRGPNRLFAAGVFGFGLVHGLGLSTRVQELGLPDDGLLPRVIAFNVGVEIGQLLALVVIVVLVKLVLDYIRRPELLTAPRALQTAGVGFAAVGATAAVVMAAAGEGADPYGDIAAASPAGCEVRTERAPTVLAGGHPAKIFYAPGETLPDRDFGHVVGDDFVVVRYRGSLPASDWQQVRTVVERYEGVVAGPVETLGAAVEARTQTRVLRCARTDEATLRRFSEAWLQERFDYLPLRETTPK